MNEVFYSSIFGELTKQVQIRIDAASELRKRLFDQNIYERGVDRLVQFERRRCNARLQR